MSNKQNSIFIFLKNILIIVSTNVIFIFGLVAISWLFSRYATEFGVDPDEWSEGIILATALSIICTSISLIIFFLTSVINYFSKKKIKGIFIYCTLFVYLIFSTWAVFPKDQNATINFSMLFFTFMLMIPVLLSLLVLWLFNRKKRWFLLLNFV